MAVDNFSQNNQRIAKNTLFLYVRLAIVMIVNLYTTRVVLDVLGVSDYGVYNVVCGFVAMFGFLNTSMSNGIQRFYNYELGKNGDQAVTKVFNTAIRIQFAIAAIILFLTETIGLWYINNQMVINVERVFAANLIFQFSVVSLVFVILQIPYSAAILAYERMDYFAIVSIADAFIKLLIVFILPQLHGDGLIIYGALIMCVSILNFALYSGYCFRNFKNLKFQAFFDKILFKSMLGFSGWNLLGSFAYVIKGQGVNILLNLFFGTVVNAANGIANQVSSAIQTFSTNLVVAFKPQLTQSYAVGNYTRTEQLMFSMSKISYLLMNIIAIPIIIEIDFVLNFWLDSEIPHYTSVFVNLTVLATMIGVLNAPVTQMIHASGKMKKYQITTCLIMCSILPISWLFLKMGYTPTSVFLITIIITILNQIACLCVLHSIFKFNWGLYLKNVVFSCILLTLITFSVGILIKQFLTVSFLSFILVFVAVLLLSIIIFFLTMSQKEKEVLTPILKKIIKKL